MSIQAESNKVRQLIDGLQKDNPRLYQALLALSKDVSNLYEELHPIQSATSGLVAAAGTPPNTPTIFTSTFGPFTVNFVWVGDPTALFYELRVGGVDWDSATFIVKTPSNGASIDALLEGSYTFRLKAINSAALYSLTDITLDITIPEAAAPSIAAQVIDNNVLLSWTAPVETFQIDHYNVYVNGVKFAEITSTFIGRFESSSGTYLYGVEAVDAAGNVSVRGEVSAAVRQPPDFEVTDLRDIDVNNMTLVNCFLQNNTIVACEDLVETFEDHFINGGWATPQEQVDDAFERFIQENLLTGSALDEFDYGVIFTNVIITLTFVKNIFSGTNDVTVEGEMSVSDDGISWSTPSPGLSQFFTSVRYLRASLKFTAPDSDSMISVGTVRVAINVKREVDANNIMCLASDVNGTEVQLPGDFSLGHGSKTFKDIDSITTTPKSVSPFTAHFDFVDVPNPTNFFIYVFDSAGRRVDSLVDWKVKGIV